MYSLRHIIFRKPLDYNFKNRIVVWIRDKTGKCHTTKKDSMKDFDTWTELLEYLKDFQLSGDNETLHIVFPKETEQ